MKLMLKVVGFLGAFSLVLTVFGQESTGGGRRAKLVGPMPSQRQQAAQ